jgi:DNA processing protein
MIKTIDFYIKELDYMKSYPSKLFYIGDTNLLQKRKISIVGTRKPNQYTKQQTYALSKALSENGFVVVSGAAMGVDAIAHEAAGSANTIGVAGTGLDIRYPSVNKQLIKDIENNGLMLSQFLPNTRSRNFHFPLRNELIVALGEVLIVSQADLNSGSMHSIKFAKTMKKKIYVLPHRAGESEGTNSLLENKEAEAIYDIDQFIENLTGEKSLQQKVDPILEYFGSNPTYDEAMEKYPSEVFEYELNGKIEVQNGSIIVI